MVHIFGPEFVCISDQSGQSEKVQLVRTFGIIK